MSLWLDDKYVRLVSSHLERFHHKAHHVYNFRCPLCGDSAKKQSKARGYLYPKGQVILFKCHNCNESMPFAALLQRVSRSLYDEYLVEKLTDSGQARPLVDTKPLAPVYKTSGFLGVEALAMCQSPSHRLYSVYKYVSDRKVPMDAFTRVFGTLNARTWLQKLVEPEKALRVSDGDPYLVLPLRFPDGSWYGAQVRMVTRKEYITFRWGHDALKVFGLDAWDPKKLTYLVEGPIDALCVPNALAACGSDLLGAVQTLKDAKIFIPTVSYALIYDNEPRNAAIALQLRRAVDRGEQVVIWPHNFTKDINDAIMSGLTPDDVLRTIRRCTFRDLRAELEFKDWSR